MSFVLLFRWVTFLLAGFACVRMALFASYDEVGGPFRYLTIWVLFASFFCVSRLIARMEGRSDRRWDAVIAATAVLNAMVVFLYWKLFLSDPGTVTRDGQVANWWMEIYLHAVGPALQIIDAVFLHKAFRKPRASAALLIGAIAGYTLWIEGVVRVVNQTPFGTVTGGLPYPFLNNMEATERAVFYGTNLTIGLAVLASLTLLSRRVPEPEAIAVPSDNPDSADLPPDRS